MCAYVIGVVRSATRLDTLVHDARIPADRMCPWKVEYTCELRPLAHGSNPELWTAWRALESVTSWDDGTLAHVLTVLRQTVPGLDVDGDLPALGPEVHPAPPPRATAAHPRAYRGTRHRPPRPPRPDAVDVRPYLIARRHIDQVLELLGQPRGIDPYVAWHFRVDATASFEPTFVTYLLPLLRECTWSELGAFASLARTMELHRAPNLRAALIGVFLAAGDATRALGWWSHVLAHEPSRRLEVARMVSATEVATVPPIAPEVATEAEELDPVRQWSFLRALARGASPAYLISGLELDAFSEVKPEELPAGQREVTALVMSTVERLGTAMDEDSGAGFWRPELWRLCGQQPELIELLASADFVALEPAAAFWLVRLAVSPRWTPDTAAEAWRWIVVTWPRLVEWASRVPAEFHRKLIEDMIDVYWWADAKELDRTVAMARCVDLCFRVAKPPFTTKAVLGLVLPYLAMVRSDDAASWQHRRALCDAPDASWLAVENACERENHARTLRNGLHLIGQAVPALLVSTFASAPGALLQTADVLAAISLEEGERVLATYKASALADPTVEDAPLGRLCALIAPVTQAGGPAPVRRALREHLSGARVLTDAQLQGHRARIVADLGIVRLAAIRQAVERVLAGRVGVQRIETPAVRHAVAMLRHVDENRRQLRRMLVANLAGDRDWKTRHPRSQEWFARHPKLDRDRWSTGIELRAELEGIGPVRLAIETDPLEALKLGTYVGSCLGRGGHFAYSAAAVVLDVNKQVVYARDARGSVVGRQLLAISEAGELVCFHVYGTVKISLLEPVFRDFDRALAAALDLPVFTRRDERDGDGDHEIATILSQDWYEDLVWDG
jgi:hypothetical protein